MYEGGHIREDDKATVDKRQCLPRQFVGTVGSWFAVLTTVMASVKSRAEALKRKIEARDTPPSAAILEAQ